MNDEWQLSHNHTILRQHNLIIQGLHFDCSDYGKKFVPNYFIQILPMRIDYFSMQMGSRLKNWRKAELWINWEPDNKDTIKKIFDSLKKQTKPALEQPLTLNGVLNYLLKYHKRTDHFHNLWSIGILYGLQNDLNNAKKYFELAIKNLRKRASEWTEKGKEPPNWIEGNIDCLLSFISRAKRFNTFQAYCKDQAAFTIKALNLKDV